MIRSALALLPLLLAGHAEARAAPPPSHRSEQQQRLKDWALSRCVAIAFEGEAAGADATRTAGALLERGDYGIETYDAIDRLVRAQLAKPYGGSVPGSYSLLQCLDLYHGSTLDRAVRAARHGAAQ
ncbi:MAG: hypothetical protein JO013_10380 [Alphaproteobacteria bacterium]|nr:hypothetical protein [Alphaproteobacteria bacterium]